MKHELLKEKKMKTTVSFLIMIAFMIGIAQGQEKTTLSVKDLNSNIEKYIKKNYKDFKTTGAFKHDAFYEMLVKKGDVSEMLIFDANGKFLKKKEVTGKEVMPMQPKSTMALKDVNSDITKYIKKNFEGYKLTEAYLFDVAYTANITKASENKTLLFDKEGGFIKEIPQEVEPVVKEKAEKADTVKPEVKKEGEKSDTIKKK